MTRRCSHSNANCQPGWPDAMVERVESFKGHLRAAPTMGTSRAPNEVEAAPVAHSPHRRREPLYARKRRVSFDFYIPKIALTTRRCSHSNANCKPGSPNTMAQRIESLKDHLRAALTLGTTRAPNEVEAAPVAQTRFPPIDAGSHFMRENKRFRAISNVQTSPWRSNSIAICAHCLANHITTASTTSLLCHAPTLSIYNLYSLHL